MAERRYLLRGVAMTAAEVASLEDVTDDEKKQFAKQAGLSDGALHQIEAMGQAMGPIVKKFVQDCIAPLAERIRDLETRPPVEWGIYDASKEYKAGVFVTSGGSMWFAKTASRGVKPGSGDASWQLCVKRGDVR
jgi:hypothetical protein